MKTRSICLLSIALVTAMCVFVLRIAHAGTSVLIWPLDPTIEAGQRSGALWLENVGSEPVNLQIRVLAWDQRDNQDDYQAQNDLISTPPFTTIPVGKKQLIRLTMTQPVQAGQELAYRILIDEIPTPPNENQHDAGKPSAALTFQMRYSLPLFVYGAGLWKKQPPAKPSLAQVAEPRLSWTISRLADQDYLVVRNTGLGHARLSQVRFLGQSEDQTKGATQPTTNVEVAPGLLGYVLPGKTMRWPLPQRLLPRVTNLQAQLDSNASPATLTPE